MSGKFYDWSGHGTVVLDPGVFAWDLPRRGADWQVGYFPRDGMGAERTLVSDIEEATGPFARAGRQVARAGTSLVSDIERYFQISGMGTNGTPTSELEEAGEHLVRAGEAVVREAEPAITKAPDRFVDYARQHPWLTLAFGAALGVFLTKYVQRRRLRANPNEKVACDVCDWIGQVSEALQLSEHDRVQLFKRLTGSEMVPVGECPQCGNILYRPKGNPEYAPGNLVVNVLGAVGKVVSVHDTYVKVRVKSGRVWSTSNWPLDSLQTDPRSIEWSIKMAKKRGEI